MSYQWLKQRLKEPRGLLYGPMLVILALATVACGAAATATPAPVPTEAPAATAEPTAVPEVMAKPPEEIMAKPETGAMAFADYWNPPTDFYGPVVYGGTLRVNYEDPLEHANDWGAATGASSRYRGSTGAVLVMENPYDAGAPVIPGSCRELGYS